jgi:hypothetical protein
MVLARLTREGDTVLYVDQALLAGAGDTETLWKDAADPWK